MSGFSLNAKNLFLTYPQCPLPLSVATGLIEDLFGDRIEYGIVCSEDHKDEGEHLHAIIVLKKRWHIRDCRKLDIEFLGPIGGGQADTIYHGDYKAAKSLLNSIKYVCKDGNYAGINCDAKSILQAAQKKTSTKAAYIASKIVEGESIESINVDNPGYVLSHLKKITNYQKWLEGLAVLNSPLTPWTSASTGGATETYLVMIAKWLNSNLGQVRPHKQRQLWISDHSMSGKSYLLMQLLNYWHGYEVPDDGNWYDSYSDGYDFCYMDEYKGYKKIQWLNSFSEGRPMCLPQRNVAPYIKKKNLPLIVCANGGISWVYSKADEVVVCALKNRFLEINIPCGDRLDIIMEHDDSDEDTAPIMSDSDWNTEVIEEGPSDLLNTFF